MLLKDLPNLEYMLLTDSQEVKAVLKNLGIKDNDITAALIWAEDGDYKSVYLTEDNSPWELYAEYHRPDYYR